jgi:hypothetical protein
MADAALFFLEKGLPGRGQKSKIIIRETNGLPFQRGGETLFDFSAKIHVRIDADPFTA